jgi:peptide/nickel transport system permease protein
VAVSQAKKENFSETVGDLPQPPSSINRVLKYVVVRILLLTIMLAVGLYLAVIVINLGGFIDKIHEDRIRMSIGIGMARSLATMPVEERFPLIEQAVEAAREAAGLNDPFLLRCLRWLWDGITFNLGETRLGISGAFQTIEVTQLIKNRLPNTLLLAGASNLLVFLFSVGLALNLSRRYGSILDKIFVALAPLSAAPNWIYGVLLLVIFAVNVRWLPFNGMRSPLTEDTTTAIFLDVLRHMVLPVSAIVLSMLFKSVYAWRTFFLLNSQEDYVELARAKGLSPRKLESAYILRPTMPFVITSFTVLLIAFWQEAIALEVLFYWPGIGQLFLEALQVNQREVMLGLVVIFAYLLAFTVFLLEFIYVLIDPRVKIGTSGRLRPAKNRKLFDFRNIIKHQAYKTKVEQPKSRFISNEGDISSTIRKPKASYSQFREVVAEIQRYPTAIAGVVIILLLISLTIYTLVTVPYQEAERHWNAEPRVVFYNPTNAQPVWVNLLRRDPLPSSLIFNSRDGDGLREEIQLTDVQKNIILTFPFNYQSRSASQDLMINVTSHFGEKQPLVSIYWDTPDGREIRLTNFTMTNNHLFILSQDERLARRLRSDNPMQAIFSAVEGEESIAVPGQYQIRIDALFFEEDVDLEADIVLYGQVYGMAGTDHRRRDLMMAIMWGAPVALAFGLLGAVGTTLSTLFLASVGVWFGGWLDDLIQRITEIVMMLPVLPIALMTFYIYSKSIWVILGVIVLLNLFGSAIKNYRAIFLQIKESPYIEAAQVYGTSNFRMITRYLIPRILPVMIPQMVIMVPGFVFLEATLAYLGVSDIYLPTWGKMIKDAITIGAWEQHFYWIFQPIALLMLTGFAFAMLGFSLDRVFNTRLKDFR